MNVGKFCNFLRKMSGKFVTVNIGEILPDDQRKKMSQCSL